MISELGGLNFLPLRTFLVKWIKFYSFRYTLNQKPSSSLGRWKIKKVELTVPHGLSS